MGTADPAIRAIVSVHDVMPETLPEIQTVLKKLESLAVAPVTILVVPGKDWSTSQIDWLREQQRHGVVIAGHGWRHSVTERSTLYHKLHGLFLSRMVAEHLSLDEQQIVDLIDRCYRWFIDHGFDAPPLYVPPAWAMGKIQNKTLDTLPFELYENFAGVYRAGETDFTRLPLTGYEADNALRTPILAGWNLYNEERARRLQQPLRITIHPRDLSLRLSRQIDGQLSRVKTFLDYQQVFASPQQAA